MKKYRNFSLGIALMSLSSPASFAASGQLLPELVNVFDYDYAEVSLASFDHGDSGIVIGGSADLQPNINVIGNFATASDYLHIDLSLGYHFEWASVSKTDVQFFAGVERDEYDVGAGTKDDSDSGLFLGGGLRASATPVLELTGQAAYHTLNSGDFSLLGGLRLQLNQQLDLKMDYTVSDNDVFTIGLRYYY